MNKCLNFLICLLFSMEVFSAPTRSRSQEDENAMAFREMRDKVANVFHEVRNQNIEMRTFDEKLQNLEDTIESIRDELAAYSIFQKEQLKETSTETDAKILSLENYHKSLLTDLKQFKTFATETSALLLQFKQKILDLENGAKEQNQNIEFLQQAMRALMDAVNPKEAKASKEFLQTKTYRVKNGDTLEKIARAHQTTVQVLKELNGLSNTDRIICDKLIQIPETK